MRVLVSASCTMRYAERSTPAGMSCKEPSKRSTTGIPIAPGDGVGTLAFGGNLTLSSGARLDFELGDVANSDLISMPGSTLNLGGQNFADFAFTTNDNSFGPGVYTLIDAGAITGSLGTSLTGSVAGLPATLSLSASGNDVILSVVPEPGTFALLLVAAIGLAVCGWRRQR